MANGPIDYSLNVQTPFEAAAGGLQLGANLANTQSLIEARRGLMTLNQQKAILAQQEAERQQALQDRLAKLGEMKNPTASDYVSIANLLPPKYAENLRQNWDVLSKEQKDNQLKWSGQVLSAFNTGSPEVGVNLLKQKSEAERNSGRTDQADFYDRAAKIAEISPDQARKMMSVMLAPLPGGEAVLKSQQAPSDVEVAELEPTEKEAEIAYKQAQTAELLSRIKKNQGVEIRPAAQKIIDTEVAKAVDLEQRAIQQDDLATNFETQAKQLGGAGWGRFGTADEFLKRNLGLQDGLTGLRQDYNRIRTSEAFHFLPPGPATDKDIELALKGFPPDDADANHISGFLRGMAKLQRYQAGFAEAGADWVAQAGGRGKMPEDTEVLEIPVSAGTSFVKFSRELGKKLKANELNLQRRQPTETAQAPAQGSKTRLTQPAPTTASNDKLKAVTSGALGDYF